LEQGYNLQNKLGPGAPDLADLCGLYAGALCSSLLGPILAIDAIPDDGRDSFVEAGLPLLTLSKRLCLQWNRRMISGIVPREGQGGSS